MYPLKARSRHLVSLQKPEEGEATGWRLCNTVVACWIHKLRTADRHTQEQEINFCVAKDSAW